MAAYQDAVSVGGLSLIGSPEVRQALANYDALVQRDQREQERVRDAFESPIAPLWSEYANVRDMLATSTMLPSDYPIIARAPRYEEMLRDPRFANSVAERTIHMMRVRGRHRAVLTAIDQLLRLVE